MLMQAIDTYLALRRAAGFRLRSTERYLRYFAHFASARGETHVRSQTAVDWAGQARTEAERHRRLRTVAHFAHFMRVEEPRHELPPEGVFCGYHRRPKPYIFTDNELQRLLAHTRRLRPSGSLRPQTYSTLFTLLAVTGLRPSEALALRLHDITPEGLVIRDTKFGKSRFVPVHITTLEALDRYRQSRCRIAGHVDHLFVSLKRCPLSLASATRTFRQVLKAAGLPDRPGCPRLYDLRHRFATRALETGPTSRELISQHMLALATYLGHTHITYTYWYLEQTPTLMADIATSCEAFVFGGRS